MAAEPRPTPLPQWNTARLLGRVQGRIRRLEGFIKGAHFEPDSHSPAVDTFLRKAGSKEVESMAESLHQDLRKQFGYKRKQLNYSCENGQASIQTPDFEISLTIFQDPEDVRAYMIETEVTQIRDVTICLDHAFLNVFEHRCRSLHFPLPQAVDVEQKIDQLEETSFAAYLDYPADTSSLTIKVPGSFVEMRLASHELLFSLTPGGQLQQLIEGALKLIAQMNMPTEQSGPQSSALPG